MKNNLCNEFVRTFGPVRHGISARVCVLGAPGVLQEAFARAIRRYGRENGEIRTIRFSETFPAALRQECGAPAKLPDGTFAIRATGGEITVYSESPRGALYGGCEVLRLFEKPEIHDALIYAAPLLERRGLKVYLPNPDEKGFADFRKLVDLLLRLRANFLMIEVGGAMEFKSHPEINAGWVEYSAFMNEYSGKPQKIQHSFDWNKNSIHTTNGGGKVVSQADLAKLLDYCRERQIEVVPEMPSLAHCDYLLTRHPELAERPEDPYPDTCCPNHPAYYPLLFDLFDEIIQVFKPKRMHIGHDEYYSVGLCPRCQGKDAGDIYAEDIRRCRDFLASRGVKTMIWGEKLLNASFPNGLTCGGAEVKVWHQPDNGIVTPPTHHAIDKMPEDLEIMHWYWSIDRQLEEEFSRRGMSMMLGNFHGRNIPDWGKRRRAANLTGVSISNWGATDLRTLQRNGILFDLVSTAAMEWNSRFDAEQLYPELRDWTLQELYRIRQGALPLGKCLEIVHTTDAQKDYKLFFDGYFVDEKADLLGYHVLRGASGKVIELPVIYGSNISHDRVSFDRHMPPREGENYDSYTLDMRLLESSYETLPHREQNGRVFYRTQYPLTAPEESYTYVTFRPVPAFTGRVEVKSFRLKGCDE